jgi:hypothetical protein
MTVLEADERRIAKVRVVRREPGLQDKESEES